jgi:hypothetical protein
MLLTTIYRRVLRRVLTAALAPVCAAGMLAATSLPPHATGHRRATTIPRPAPAARGLLTRSQAQQRARATHRRVAVTALTTPYSATVANPNGSFTLTQTLRPTRTWQHGRWVPLNASLRRVPGGRIVPEVAAVPLSLSGGGSGALAVLDQAGYPLSLTWPSPLPTPSLSGDTATYANVLPGVDLLVTADTQGNLTTTLVVHDAAAAANPALSSLQITESAPGLTLAADTWGSLSWATSPQADPVFTSPAPLVWDSTPLPPGTPTVTEPDGTVVAQGTGASASSTPTAPGAAANVAKIPVTISGNTITMSPPAAALTGSNITYPVYLDPSFLPDPIGKEATHWTQVESNFPGNDAGWDESSDLQVGYCYGGPSNYQCDDPTSGTFLGYARSFFRMPVSTDLDGATIQSSELFTTNDWAPDCSNPSAVELWTTGVIRSSTDFANQPNWLSQVGEQKVAFGNSGCGWTKGDVTWNVKDVIQDDANNAIVDQTFGLRADDENDQNQWKKFHSGSDYLTMTTTYWLPPAHPDRTTSPGGACYYSQSGAPVIGNDDVTFYATAYDATLDNDLTTTFFIVNPKTGNPVYQSSANTADGDTAQITVQRPQWASFNPNGSGPYTYYWYAIVSNSHGQSSNPPTDHCYFTYDPTGPSQPTVQFTPTDASGDLGTQISVVFSTPNCGTASAPCPDTYTYQNGIAPPVTVTAGSSTGAPSASQKITIIERGSYQLSVYGTAPSGNISETATPPILGLDPANAYPDAYFTGGTHPDLLLTGTSSTPSLWLYPGVTGTGSTGDGTLGAPVDIGSLGDTFKPSNQSSDGPADWTGAQILHGDFTTDAVQDILAYYPATTSGVIMPGNGNASTPYPGNAKGLPAGFLSDPYIDPPPSPDQVVAAGDASQQNNGGTTDLIGIMPTGSGYQLMLYPACGYDCFDPLGPTELSDTPPDTKDHSTWDNYTLATAQPGCYPGGTCDPSATVLFALDNNTGTLWEAAHPSQLTPGTTTGWQKITNVSWGTAPPTLVSADVNASGTIELWTTSGTTATSYALTGTSLSQEQVNSIALPSDEWPLTDGDQQDNPNASTAVDTTGGNTATLTGPGTYWGSDAYFHTDIQLGDQQSNTGYFPPSPGTVPVTDPDPTISVWFKTTAPGGVIASLQGAALTPSGTSTTFDPVLYVGTDGYLYAQWYTGTVAPLTSNNTSYPVIVNDGLWHHAVLAATGSGSNNTQTLTVDGHPQGSLTGALKLQGDTKGNTNLTFGAGYTGGHWPAEPNQNQTSAPDYFQGQIADITFNQ